VWAERSEELSDSKPEIIDSLKAENYQIVAFSDGLPQYIFNEKSIIKL